jgi:hypothetical protein
MTNVNAEEGPSLKRSALYVAAAVSVVLAVTPMAAVAAPSGLAWDSVTKLAMGADASSLQPGSFADDYAAASAPAQAPTGGLFGKMMGQNMQAMLHSGDAQRHYVAGSKERTDEVARQTATIVDCSARTITTLDLAKKTYRVVSMDQPGSPSSGGTSGGGAMPKDDGTKVAIDISNTALGSRRVDGEATNGFSSAMTFTETQASGESRTQNASLVGYYTSLAMPMPQCSGAWNASGIAGGQGMGMMAAMSKVMQALKSAGMDKRFSVKQSGPTLPLGSFAMFQAVSFGSQGGHSPSFMTERGNVRPVDANDPAFSVPSDFTKQP